MRRMDRCSRTSAGLADLATEKGLDPAEASIRLQKYGPNRLPEGRKRGAFTRLLAQFNNILVYVLLGNVNLHKVAPDGFTALCANTHPTVIAIDVTTDAVVDLNGAAPGTALSLQGYSPGLSAGTMAYDAENDRRVLAALRRLDGVRLRDDEPLREEHLVDQTHLRAKTRAGVIDAMRGGLPPLDYETVEERAMPADYGGVEFLVASLSSIVGFKRLAGRPRDRNDLIGLTEIHGDLPNEPIPGLDED